DEFGGGAVAGFKPPGRAVSLAAGTGGGGIGFGRPRGGDRQPLRKHRAAGVGLSALRSTLMFRASTPNHVDSLSPWAGVRRASRRFSALQHRQEVAGRLRGVEQADGATIRAENGWA